jgi:3-mercaptopyruvate sulfurtransferase SseA
VKRRPVVIEGGHIPGAVHSDYALDGWRVQKDGAGGLLPELDSLATLLGRLGVDPSRHVVIVSAGMAPSDFSAAARVYWTLKIAGHRTLSILDGGHAVDQGRSATRDRRLTAFPSRRLSRAHRRPCAPGWPMLRRLFEWAGPLLLTVDPWRSFRAARKARKPRGRVACLMPSTDDMFNASNLETVACARVRTRLATTAHSNAGRVISYCTTSAYLASTQQLVHPVEILGVLGVPVCVRWLYVGVDTGSSTGLSATGAGRGGALTLMSPPSSPSLGYT